VHGQFVLHGTHESASSITRADQPVVWTSGAPLWTTAKPESDCGNGFQPLSKDLFQRIQC
jgi:hypothetical protein